MDTDLNKIPVTALRKATLAILSGGLNAHKVIPTEEGLPRDWRGLAHLIGLNGVETSRISAASDQIAELINQWGAQGTVEKLTQFLSLIDRFDVLEDVETLIATDVEVYLTRASTPQQSVKANSTSSDASILTVDDVVRLEQGLEPQVYDAYLLFADEDIDFASQIVDNMERQYKMKLCIRDRDLVGGITFEHDAIMKLIAERCRRLLVVVSPNFLKSPANKFFVTFAQALGIEQRQRKVIPILYEHCDLPPELSYYFLLNYSRAGVLWNFWDKLRDSIQVPEATACASASPWMSRALPAPEPPEGVAKKPVKGSKSEGVAKKPVKGSKSEEIAKKPVKSTKSEPVVDKKPLLKNITSSLSNLVTSKEKKIVNGEEKVVKSGESVVNGEEVKKVGEEKEKKRKWFGKKKAEPLAS